MDKAKENNSENKDKASGAIDNKAPKSDVKTGGANASAKPQKRDAKQPYSRGKQSRDKKSNRAGNEDETQYVEKVISINRITKVTKGGKNLSFRALVVVGDKKGNVGYSLCKAKEVATAIKKAMSTAKKNMVAIPMEGTSIPHEIIGKCGGSRVLLKPASEGTGVIASGPVRAICDGAGIHNILTKCHRSNNPINVVKATLEGLSRLKTRPQVVESVESEA